MRQALKLHPDSHCPAATRIDVEVARPSPGHLVLHYFVAGRMSDLRIPPVTAPLRADGLWRHTCFEAFVRPSQGTAYYEFNFAPSTQWAAYRFSDYRRGMRAASEMNAPCVEVQSNAEGCTLRASLELDRLPGLPGDATWRLGVAAVIEEAGGRTSYWALAHPPGQADFHHPDGFVNELGAAERP